MPRRRVDFPQALAPTMTVTRPAGIAQVRPFTTSCVS